MITAVNDINNRNSKIKAILKKRHGHKSFPVNFVKF